MDINRTIDAALLEPNARLNRGRVAAPAGWDAGLNGAGADAARRLVILGHLNGSASPMNAAQGVPRPSSATAPFAQLLNDEQARRPTTSMPDERRGALQKSSETLVNQFFMGSMLKQMRESPFKDETFSGGKGGAAYAGLFDQRLAENAGGRIAKSLVASMVRQYERTSTGAGVATPGAADAIQTLNAAAKAGRARHDASKAGRDSVSLGRGPVAVTA